jgi:hypothetical protein
MSDVRPLNIARVGISQFKRFGHLMIYIKIKIIIAA